MYFKFPENFYWGASTSSHQVEGGNINSWSVWEENNKDMLADEGISRSINENSLIGVGKPLDHFRYLAKNADNYVSGRAVDHYNRFREDFALAKQMNHNAHRFSIEWSRIEPEEGVFNTQEIQHYREVLEELRKLEIEPFVTLWHWTFPLWIDQIGGWENSKTPEYFRRYAERVVSEFKDLVKFWITINEPMVYTSHGYTYGVWPPQKKSLLTTYIVTKRQISGHKKAYKTIKQIDPDAQVGIAKGTSYFQPKDHNLVNNTIRFFANYYGNFFVNDRIRGYQDFLGLNCYFRNLVDFGVNKNENKVMSDMGWELFPHSIYGVCEDFYKRYKLPIYITENGLADAQDYQRGWFIKETVKSLSDAIKDGIDVRGYLHWSFIDNFEWDKGFWPRFGLIEVDYDNDLERKPRDSAWVYAEIIRNNGLIE